MRPFRFPRPDSPVLRLQVQPDKPRAFVAPRPRGSRRPHKDATVAEVRRLIEGTALNYAEIAARTGVARASICRWTRAGGWKRHLFAPRATDTVPRERASARLRARTLAARLDALAERYVRELEETPGIDLTKLGEALELMKMAKLATRPKRRKPRHVAEPEQQHVQHPRPNGNEERSQLNIPSPLEGEGDATCTWPRPAAVGQATHDSAPGSAKCLVASGGGYAEPIVPSPARTAVLEELRAAGVNLERAPQAAVEDFIASRTPPKLLPRDDPALRRRGHRSRKNREHEWMLGRDG